MSTYQGALTANNQTRNKFEAIIPHGVDLGALLSAHYWWPVSKRMNPLDTIECLWEDGSRVVVLRVAGKDERAQRVLVHAIADQAFDAPALPEGFRYEFVNRDQGWRIMQEGRRAPLRSGFSTTYEAHAWLTADGQVEEQPPAPAPAATPAAGSTNNKAKKLANDRRENEAAAAAAEQTA